MTSNVPKPIVDYSGDILRRIAMDIGKEVVAHLEHAHSEMFNAVRSPESTKLSIRNATHNAIIAACDAADKGQTEQHIKMHERHRREMRRLRSKVKSYIQNSEEA